MRRPLGAPQAPSPSLHSGTPLLLSGGLLSPKDSSLALLDLHAGAAGDDADVHHVQEQAVVHDALQSKDGLGGWAARGTHNRQC